MDKPQDILLDATGDIAIQNGDMVIGDSKQQHISLLLRTRAGEWKQHPRTGIGLADYLNSEDPYDLNRMIRQQLTQDGCQVDNLQTVNGKIKIEAQYVNEPSI